MYTWKTSGGLADDAIEIVGTVKSHNEYKDVKQTELTRVRTTRRIDKENEVCKSNEVGDVDDVWSIFEE